MADAPDTCPVHDWATDYDIFDPDYVRDPGPRLGRSARPLPDRTHAAVGRLLDADPLRRPAEAGQDGARAFVALAGPRAAASRAARSSGGRGQDVRQRDPADQLRPAGAQALPATHSAVLLPARGGGADPLHARALQPACRRFRRRGPGGRCRRLRAADHPSGHRACSGHRPRARRRIRHLGARADRARPDAAENAHQVSRHRPRFLPGHGD